MAGRDEISSTERLLDLIRETGDDNGAEAVRPSAVVSEEQQDVFFPRGQDAADIFPGTVGFLSGSLHKAFFSKFFAFREKITIGIDFRYSSLKLVTFSGTSAQNRKLTDYLSVPSENYSPGNSHLQEILKSVLKYLCSSSPKKEIWAVIPLDNFEIKYLTVPKVGRKELSNAVYWAYKKLKPFEEEESIFDYEYIGEVSENGIRKKAVVAYTVPRQKVEEVRNYFSNIGFPLTGISVYPFALQNIIKSKYIGTDGQDVCCLYVGMNWSRIDIFFPDGNLVLSRRIRACMNSMIEELRFGLKNIMFPSAPDNERPDELSGKNNSDNDNDKEVPAYDIFSGLVLGIPDLNRILAENRLKISRREIFDMLIPAIERLIWTVERTIESYQADIGKGNVGKILIFGQISASREVMDYLGKRLEKITETRETDPFTFDFVRKSMPIPDTILERRAYIPAVGIALSQNFFTPNLIYTHLEKEKYFRARRTDRMVTVLFGIIAFLCLGFSFMQENTIRARNMELRSSEKKFETLVRNQGGLVLSRSIIQQITDSIIEKRVYAKDYARRYIPLAVIAAVNEITQVSPVFWEHLTIRLADTGKTETGKTGTDSKDKEKKDSASTVTLRGLVLAERLPFFEKDKVYELSELEAVAIDFKSVLEKHPVFRNAVFEPNKDKEKYGEQPVFRFTIDAELNE